jgi:hypothetical protein
MKMKTKTILLLGLFVSATSFAKDAKDVVPTRAEETHESDLTNGLLGTSYVEISYLLQDLQGVSPNLNNAGIGVNLRVVPSLLDLGADYGYGWIDGAFSGQVHQLGGSATLYTTIGTVKPFLRARLGVVQSHSSFAGNDQLTEWRVGLGLEIPIGKLTLTPQALYSDNDYGAPNRALRWTGQLEANYAFTRCVNGFVAFGYTDFHYSSIDPWDYQVGFRFKF